MSGRRLRNVEKRRKRRNKKDPIRIVKGMVKEMRYYADTEPFYKSFRSIPNLPTTGKTMKFKRFDEIIMECSYCLTRFHERFYNFSVVKNDAGKDMEFCAECLKIILFNQKCTDGE